MDIRAFLKREVDFRHLSWGILVAAPDLLLYLWTGSPIWFHGALVTICLLIVQTRTTTPSLALLGLHAITMAILTALFYLAVPSTVAFALCAASVGFMTFGITLLDGRLFSFGNWNFIPPLYIACEMSPQATGPERWTYLGQLLLIWPLSVACVALVLRPAFFASDDKGWQRWFGLAGLDPKPVSSAKIYRAASARGVAVLLATVLMTWEDASHGEWGIWSAASVVNPTAAQTLEKFGHRALGAIGGVLAGLLIGPLLPHSKTLYVFVVLGVFLTLIVIKRYPAAFATRCFLITIAAYAAALGIEDGRDRVMNVLTGSAVGLVVTLVFKFISSRIGTRK